jgi:hypothetical protein
MAEIALKRGAYSWVHQEGNSDNFQLEESA